MVRKRPKNLNLLTIRLPVPALVSIMHSQWCVVILEFAFMVIAFLAHGQRRAVVSVGTGIPPFPVGQTVASAAGVGVFSSCLCGYSSPCIRCPFGSATALCTSI